MDTIVAIATPPGRSAIGMIRLSGPQSLAIIRSLVRDDEYSPQANHVTLKTIFEAESGEVLDQALVCYFQAPHSFTGDDMVEISCHGSPVVLRQLLDQILKLDGRLAGPGEFTLRACRNGKMNLSQAEAIRDLIEARTKVAAQQATRQLKGELSEALEVTKQELIKIIVRLESALEFVEDDLPEVEMASTLDQLTNVIKSIDRLARTYGSGHLLREGISVTLAGRPNVGKSSLFNKLVQSERAIVTGVPGTTRDSLTETVSMKGVPVRITDTAGLRATGDEIEKIGVERTHRAIADADLLVVVLDGSAPLLAEDLAVLEQAKPLIHVVAINKCDLLNYNQELTGSIGNNSRVVHVSAKTGEGLDELSNTIVASFGSVDSEEVGLLVTDSRHHDLLVRARDSLDQSRELLNDNASEELVLVGLHNGLKYLGEITGETTSDEILGRIFSTFCIGK